MLRLLLSPFKLSQTEADLLTEDALRRIKFRQSSSSAPPFGAVEAESAAAWYAMAWYAMATCAACMAIA